MPNTMQYTGSLVITSCWCGIHLAVPQDLYDIANRNGKTTIYCPLGHTFIYGDAENARLKREKREADEALELSRRQTILARNQRDAAYRETEHERRSKAAVKGHLTRIRNKVANGVCPVGDCRRHFDNVQAHIATEHPTWHVIDPETGEAAVLS